MIRIGGLVLHNPMSSSEKFAVISPNFSFMAEYDEILYKCAVQAERFLFEDSNTTLYKLRQFGELLAQDIAARIGIYIAPEDNAFKIIPHRTKNSLQILQKQRKRLTKLTRKSTSAKPIPEKS